MKYKIKEIFGNRMTPKIVATDKELQLAASMREDYGISLYLPEEIAETWKVYSEEYMANWINPTKARVEKAFNLSLTEKTDNSKE